MTANYTIRILIILVGFTIGACKSEKESHEEPTSPRIKKFSKISQPSTNQKYILGDAIDFKIDSSEPIDSIVVEYGSQVSSITTTDFQWAPDQPRTGKQKVRLTVYSGDDSETHYARVIFLSDVTPMPYTYQVIGEYPHDEDAFVQGLFFMGDTLVESTGQEGTSKISKTNYKNGAVYQSTNLEHQYFGEGSTYWGDRIYYLTWTTNKGFVYDRNLNRTGQWNYTYEGWGMTTMGDTLVVSDGKETLHFLDPRDLSELGSIEVYSNKGKITNLNELEYFDGVIYANLWQEDVIITIDPKTGKMLSEIDLSGLRASLDSRDAEVLNGIAYKQNTGQIFVTGKLWPKLFEVKFAPIN